MRRFLLPVLAVTLALLLQACGGGGGAPKAPQQWGGLRVTLENVQQTENQWSANLTVNNTTDKMQAFQYNGSARYTMTITREGQTILRRDFDRMDPQKPEIVNIAKGVSKGHPVVWTFLDDTGARVPAGTYEVTVKLNAVTTGTDAQQANGGVVEAPVQGPVKITVK